MKLLTKWDIASIETSFNETICINIAFDSILYKSIVNHNKLYYSRTGGLIIRCVSYFIHYDGRLVIDVIYVQIENAWIRSAMNLWCSQVGFLFYDWDVLEIYPHGWQNTKEN